MKEEDIAGIPDKEGISKRFEEFLERNIVNNKAAALLKESYHYLVHEKGAVPTLLYMNGPKARQGTNIRIPTVY